MLGDGNFSVNSSFSPLSISKVSSNSHYLKSMYDFIRTSLRALKTACCRPLTPSSENGTSGSVFLILSVMRKNRSSLGRKWQLDIALPSGQMPYQSATLQISQQIWQQFKWKHLLGNNFLMDITIWPLHHPLCMKIRPHCWCSFSEFIYILVPDT